MQGLKIRYAAVGVWHDSDNTNLQHSVQDSTVENVTTAVQIKDGAVSLSNLRLCDVGNLFQLVSGSAPGQSGITTNCTGGYIEVAKNTMTPDASSFFPASHPWAGGWDWDGPKAIDGSYDDPCWHCDFAEYPVTGPGPWLRLNLNTTKWIGKVQYAPRAGLGNGTFNGYRIFVTSSSSTSPATWGDPVAQGSWNWSYGVETKTVEFAPKQGQYVIFQCTSGAGDWASAGEVWVYEATAESQVAKTSITPVESTPASTNGTNAYPGGTYPSQIKTAATSTQQIQSTSAGLLPTGREVLTIDRNSGEISSSNRTGAQMELLNSAAQKQARLDAIYSAEKPEEYARSLRNDPARIQFEQSELQIIMNPQTGPVTVPDPNKQRLIDAALRAITHPAVSPAK